MVRVNGKVSVGKLMNVYPDPAVGHDVLHLYLEVPGSEFSHGRLMATSPKEVDWTLELVGMMFLSKEGLAEVLLRGSARGQFIAKAHEQTKEGYIPVALQSVGTLKPLESSQGIGEGIGHALTEGSCVIKSLPAKVTSESIS